MSVEHTSIANERAIFESAAEIADIQQRKIYLERACRGDTELYSRVERLLGFYDNEQSFLSEKNLLAGRPTDTNALIGQHVGRYKLLESLGEGGFGVVYLAEQSGPVHRKVALKLIKPGMDTRQVIARFDAERQALAVMNHPHIARVLDGGSTDQGRPYFVMEFVDGVPITEFCDTNQLNTVERLKLFIIVCHAVRHAHQKGIIHRDIKPSNVLVSLDDGAAVPRVIDFGIAKAIGQQLVEDTLVTRQGQIVGTPQYMSPEQAEHRGFDIDTRSDVYSLGVLLYELLTGQTPLDKDVLKLASDEEFHRLIKEEEAPKPSSKIDTGGAAAETISQNRGTLPSRLRQLLQGELDWIALKAVNKERDRRYESPSALADDIDRFLNEKPVTAGPPSSLYRARKFIRRNRGWVAAMAAVAASLFVGLTISLLTLREVRVQAEIAEANFDLTVRMLTTVDPAAGNVTVLQMLDQFVTDLPNHLLDKPPQVRANFHLMLGKMYARLGEQQQADEQFVQAVSDQRQIGDPRALAGVLLDRATNAMNSCYYEAAHEAAAEASEILENDDSESLRSAREICDSSALCVRLMSTIWKPMNNCKHDTVAKEVKRILQSHPDLKLRGVVHSLIVNLYADNGDFKSAEALCHGYSEAFVSQRESLGSQHWNAVTYEHFFLGFLAETQGKLPDAEYHFHQVLDQKDQVVLRNGDNAWVESLYAWAILRPEKVSPADLEDAERRAKLVVHFVEHNPDALNSITAIAYHVMASVKEEQQDLTAAIEFQRKAHLECERKGWPRHMLIQLAVEEQLARLLAKNGSPLAAKVVADQAIKWREDKLSDGHYQHGEAESRLKEFRIQQ